MSAPATDPPPRHDPVPSPSPMLMRRFWRIFRWLSLFSIIIAAIAVILVARGEPGAHVHMLIATALGAGFTVLVGAALMTLVFLSSSSGHDAAAGAPPDDEGRQSQ